MEIADCNGRGHSEVASRITGSSGSIRWAHRSGEKYIGNPKYLQLFGFCLFVGNLTRTLPLSAALSLTDQTVFLVCVSSDLKRQIL